MTKQLQLTDIQGNIVQAYGRASFIFARYLFLKISDGNKGRCFVDKVLPKITSAKMWERDAQGAFQRPEVTTNMAFSFKGLQALQLPMASLQEFPKEFIMGMKARKDILGDDGISSPAHWDDIWENEVHVWISINAQNKEAIAARYQFIVDAVNESGGVSLLTGHKGVNGETDLPYQDANTIFEDGKPTAKEHFGYRDGISDPVFEGQDDSPGRVLGRGKIMADGSWKPLATGEFILGHPDEAMEYAKAPTPVLLSKNGTFMVYRKLHENVGSFNQFIEGHGRDYPGGSEVLAAKIAGRWRDNGAPVTDVPDQAAKDDWDKKFYDESTTDAERKRMLTSFNYNDDLSGSKCPLSAHTRRTNPRGSLEFGQEGAFDTPGALTNRRRLIRRGLPYGKVDDLTKDDGEHGIIFMALNASIERQFEFVQQQWVNYGNDFKEGNDKDVILGNHSACPMSKVVHPVDEKSDAAPYFLGNIPRLVETRGGEYFFVPSLTALSMIAQGIVDPT